MTTLYLGTQNEQINGMFVLTLGAAAGSTYLAAANTLGLAGTAAALVNATGATTNAALATIIGTNLGATDSGSLGLITSFLNTYGSTPTAAAAAGALPALITTLNKSYNTSTYAGVQTFFTNLENATAYSNVAANNSTNISTLQSAVTSSSTSTYTLTTGSDNQTANIFYGAVGVTGGAGGTDTLNASDSVTGTSGSTSNVLNITDTATNTDVTNGANISNIQTMNVKPSSGVTATLNASSISGLTAVNNTGLGAVTVTNLATGASIGVVGNGAILNGTTSYAYKTATAAQTINISGGTTGGAVTATASTGVTTVTINSTGASNVIGTATLDSASGSTITALTINATTSLNATLVANNFASTAALTVTGAASALASTTTGGTTLSEAAVDILGTAINWKTVDASAMSAGGVAVALGTNTTSFKGGAGNDVVYTAAIAATTAGSVDGGAGTNTLVVTAAANVNTATLAGLYTNFSTIRDNVATTAIDISLFGSGVTAVQLNNAVNSVSNLSATQAANITEFATTTSSTIALANSTGSSDTVKISTAELDGATGAINLVGLNMSGVENLTLTNGSTAASTYSFATGSGLQNITLLGAKNITLDIDSQQAALKSVDASGMTSTATVTVKDTTGGHALVSSTYTGTANADTFSFGGTTGTDTMAAGVIVTVNGGAGNDSFTATTGQLYTGGSGYIAFNGGSGTDTLTIANTSAGTVSDNVFIHSSGLEKLTFSGTGTVTFVSGGSFNSAFTTGVTLTDAALVAATSASFDLSLYGQASTIAITTANIAASTITILGAAAANTITVTAAAYTGVAGGITVTDSAAASTNTVSISSVATGVAGAIVVNTYSGNTDTITVTHGAQDAFNLVTYNIATNNNDTITGFLAAGGAGLKSDKLDLSGTATVLADITSATNATGLSNVTFTTTSGLLTLGGTSAGAVTLTQELAIAQQALQVAAVSKDTVGFVFGANSYIVHADTASTYTTVTLVGVTETSLITNGATVTSGAVYIA